MDNGHRNCLYIKLLAVAYYISQFCLRFLALFLFISSSHAAISSYEVTPGSAIPDNGCPTYTNSIINVPDSILVNDLNVSLNISHNRRSDLIVRLTSPSGTTLELFSQVGGTSNNFDVELDSDATSNITAINGDHVVAAPFYENIFTPETAAQLDNYDTEDASGNWTLGICDTVAGQPTGTLNRVSLIIGGIPSGTSSIGTHVIEASSVYLPATTGTGDNFTTVTFDASFPAGSDVVVFVLPTNEGADLNGDQGEPATVRIRGVTNTGFEIIQVEPPRTASSDCGTPVSASFACDGAHAAMTIHYVAVLEGRHELDTGVIIEAGSYDTSRVQHNIGGGPTESWETHSFGAAFAAAPATVLQVQTMNNESNLTVGSPSSMNGTSSPFVVTTADNMNAGTFDFAVGLVEVDDNVPAGGLNNDETIGWLAFPDGGNGTFVAQNGDTIGFSAARTNVMIQGWDSGTTGNQCYDDASSILTFPVTPAISDFPLVVASLRTLNGGDGGWARRCLLNDLGSQQLQVGLTVDEDQDSNTERQHGGTEAASIIAFTGPTGELDTNGLNVDFGDAPASYGDASHLTPRTTELEYHVIPAANVFGDGSWYTMSLDNDYTSPVVVCTYNLQSSTDPEATVRVHNVDASANTFDVRIQRPLNNTASPPTSSDVHCLIAEEGLHTLPDGRQFEAHTVLSTNTSGNGAGGWNGTGEDVSADVSGNYVNPVVLGQVMTQNDSDFSVFWSYDCDDRANPPFQAGMADGICVGKHIGQFTGTRANETLGYIIVESGSGSYGGINYEAALGADSVLGVGNTPPYSYSLGQTYDFAVATAEAVDGGDGGWAVLYGANPLATSQIDLAIEEETVTDGEHAHTNEQVAYWAFTQQDQPYIGSTQGDAESASQSTVAADGDNNNSDDDELGVSFSSPAGTNQSIFAAVTVSNPVSSNVTVCGWLDVPSGGAVDGAFDTSDGSCQATSLASTTLNFQWSNLPKDAEYTTYARFRISTDSLSASDATGLASDGEVEDYRIVFNFQTTSVTIDSAILKNVDVMNYLDALGIKQMSAPQLLAMLVSWDPQLASSIAVDTDIESILRALINYLDPDGDGKVAVFYWNTLQEQGTIGFYVWRRRDDSDWVRLNNRMLPGLIHAPMGGDYILADPGANEAGAYQYRLVEKEAWGSTKVYGPFDVEIR